MVKTVVKTKKEARFQKGLFCNHCYKGNNQFNETLTKFGKNSWARNKETKENELVQRYLCHTCGKTTKRPLTKQQVEELKAGIKACEN